ncbi:cytochrome P450 315a1, mitochondrial-like isoform X2 [Artemia franciscana]|uniref:cytochrome P450 315a1, mitochondrial-like isoform X2 n=1 Tax=Artemia franciscana TaxID=6661 RepID=UPI0032DACDF9
MAVGQTLSENCNCSSREKAMVSKSHSQAGRVWPQQIPSKQLAMRTTARQCALQAARLIAPARLPPIIPNGILPYESVPTPSDDKSSLLTSQIHDYIDAKHKETQVGDIFRDQLGHVKGLWLSNPGNYQQVFEQEGEFPKSMKPEAWKIYNEDNKCKRGLFFMEGNEWHTCQRIVRPLMLSQKSSYNFGIQLESLANSYVESWGKRKKLRNLEEELYSYFLEGLMVVVFGRNYEGKSKKQIPRLVGGVRGLFTESARMTLYDPYSARKPGCPGHNVWRKFSSSMSGALSAGEDIVNENLKNCESGSLCANLILAGLSISDVKRILIDLFLAAGDTTSHSMQWVFYLISQKLEIQEKIAQEVKQVRGCIHSFTSQIPTLKGAVKEALRLYPVAPFITRVLPHEAIIGNFHIPAETLVFMSTYTSGRDERFFSQPTRFWPERWGRRDSNKQVGVSHPLASMPFGHSTRNCVGKHLALTQMYLLLSKFLH